ncbi:MAG TPA: hypothetical protein GXZ60_02750 [Intrasporangiaceae bacterium]|nr:hypothetical protein [Intrasporangiaceae bacterium]
MLPRIVAGDGFGFRWALPEGAIVPLVDLFTLPDAEPERWLPTHLEALDELSIEVTGRFGAVLGGERQPEQEEYAALTEVYTVLDRAVGEYAEAFTAARAQGLKAPVTLRAGQIIGTATLLGILARMPLGLAGPAPFDGDLDAPPAGIIGGRAGLHPVDEARPWLGGRWLVITDEGLRLPATLAMLLSDSSGVDKDATLREHREFLTTLAAAAGDVPPDATREAAGAVDWMLFDWIMAHRESEDSPGVQVRSVADARLIIDAAAASVRLRTASPRQG